MVEVVKVAYVKKASKKAVDSWQYYCQASG